MDRERRGVNKYTWKSSQLCAAPLLHPIFTFRWPASGRGRDRAHSHRAAAAGACARWRWAAGRRLASAEGHLRPHRNCAQFDAMQWKRRRRVHYVIGSGKRALSLRQYRLLFRGDVTAAAGQSALDDAACFSPAAFLLELNSSGEGITRATHASTPPLRRYPHPTAFHADWCIFSSFLTQR